MGVALLAEGEGNKEEGVQIVIALELLPDLGHLCLLVRGASG